MKERPANKVLIRNCVAIGATVLFSVGTALLGWMSYAGAAMAFAFLLVSPVIALIATKGELQFSLFYVSLSILVYYSGLIHWHVKSLNEILNDISADGGVRTGGAFLSELCISLFGILPVYICRLVKGRQ